MSAQPNDTAAPERGRRSNGGAALMCERVIGAIRCNVSGNRFHPTRNRRVRGACLSTSVQSKPKKVRMKWQS